ncbi:unnamed protein product [Closterium sp. NIES-64]|nr:unnamed protein product [Closterium sp. NIES-64]
MRRPQKHRPVPRHRRSCGLTGKCGRGGEGATDVRTQAFKKHEGTVKHRFALKRQEDLLQKYGDQRRIGLHPKAQDKEMVQMSALVESLYFMSSCNEPMDAWIRLVRYLAKKKVPGFPEQGYGMYYNT